MGQPSMVISAKATTKNMLLPNDRSAVQRVISVETMTRLMLLLQDWSAVLGNIN